MFPPPRRFLTIQALPVAESDPAPEPSFTEQDIQKFIPIPLALKLRMPAAALKELQKLWLDPPEGYTEGEGESFSAEFELHESRHGFVIVEVKWDAEAEKLDIGAHLYNDDEDPEKETECLWASQQLEMASEKDKEKLDQIWVAVEPVEQIVHDPRDRVVGPNDPCECGSKKKFKKCCGRLR